MLVGKIKKNLVFKISRVVLLLITMVASISIHCLAGLHLFVSEMGTGACEHVPICLADLTNWVASCECGWNSSAGLPINTAVVAMTNSVSTGAACDQQQTSWSLPRIIPWRIIPCYFTKYILLKTY